jgi:ankyrin repeat protein
VKKKDPEQAEHLLDQLEIKPNPKMVPYTKIREKIKNHQNTQSQIKQMRTKKNINHVYFCSFDDDFEQLRYSEQGLFSEYDRLISDHESENGHPPHVVSTGYLVMSPQNPIIEVGVKLDMVVREATSRYFKNGIYYPEPNTMIYVKPEQDKIEASFLPKKNKNGNSCKNEMPNLLSDLVQKRKLNPNKSFVFNPTQAPLVTKMPNRMLFHRKKPKSIKMFDGIKSKNAKLLRYSFHDLQILIETQQSHVNSRDWANMIVDKCLIIPKSRDIEGITLSSIEIRGCLKSLVPRIFTYFNPIYTAHTRFKDNVTIDGKMSNYIYHLENTLINYETTLELKPYIPASSQNRDKLKNPNLITLRKKMDALTDFGTLLTYIANLLNDSIMAETIKKAAQSAGLAIVKELSTSLSFDYPKIVYAMLTDLLEKIDGGPCLDYQELGKLTIDVLESLADNSFFNTYEKYTLDKLNEISLDYGLNLLHISALSGNKAAVKFLIGKGMSLRCTTRDDDIIAIHFAIKYCAEQGDDLELIKLCVSADLYSQPLELCLNMLEMAITTLDNPLTVVRILCEHGAMRPELREPLYQVIQKAQPRELLYPLLACIHYQPENCELALEMIENGCNIDEVGIIESTTNEDDSYSITPLFECISRANLRLLKVILDQGAKVIEVYDHYDRTPLLATLDHSDNYSMIIIQLLLEYGAELDDCDNREYTCLIHELISPVLSCFVEPDPVRDNFLAAFPDTVRQLRITPPPENDLFDYVLRESTPHYLDIQDGADNTPLDVALEAKNVETVEKLISAGSSTDHLEREDFEYIRKFTYHTDLYQSNEEEMAEEEKRELAEEALAAEGVSLLNPDDPKEFMEIYKALTLYDIESPEDIIEDLYERAKKVDCEEQISSARSSSSLNDRDKKRHCPSPNPTDFKYDDEEDPDAEEEDYPDTPPKSDSSSPIQSDDDDSYEMSYNSN